MFEILYRISFSLTVIVTLCTFGNLDDIIMMMMISVVGIYLQRYLFNAILATWILGQMGLIVSMMLDNLLKDNL